MKTNAYALVAHQLASAALGFVYWLLAARLYPVESVGLSSAAISTVLLISGISQLGLVGGLGRFLPRAGTHARRLVASAYGTAAISAGVVAMIALLVGSTLGLTLTLPGSIHPAWVVLATVAWTLFHLQDGALIGLREAPWVLAENFAYNAAKIVALVVLAGTLADAGIVVSWFLPAPVMVILVTFLLFTRLLRSDRLDSRPARADRFSLREFITSVSGEHIGSMVSESAVRVLPLLVVQLMGAAANAYFYQAWMIATVLGSAASGMSHSFTAETAADRSRVGANSRAILVNIAMLLLPAIAVLLIGAPAILSIFGETYARESAPVLRWLAVATIPLAFNDWYLAHCRVMGRIRRLISLQVLSSATLLAVAFVALNAVGVVGIGIAWLIAQCAVTAVVARDAIRVLRSPGSASTRDGRNGTGLRRSDWRFLLPDPLPERTAVFADGDLERSVRVLPGTLLDGRTTQATDCDLCVASRPDAGLLEKCAASLRPNGVLYAEWRWLPPGGAYLIRRRLAQAGFENVTVLWPAPDIHRAGVWLQVLPRDGRHATAAAHAMRLSLGRTLPGRAGAVLLGMALQVALIPSVVVVARAPGSAPELPGTFADVLARALAGKCDAGDSSEPLAVMRTGGRDNRNKINWLVFAGRDARLACIAKTARVPASHSLLRREFAALEALAAHIVRDGPGIETPRPVELGAGLGLPVFVQTALAGPPLLDSARTNGYARTAMWAAEAMSTLAAQPQLQPQAVWWDRLIEPWLNRLARQIHGTSGAAFVEDVRSALTGLRETPLVWAHGDCTPWNALVTERGLALFDWEEADEQGLALTDLVYLLTTLACTLEGTANSPQMIDTYRRLLDPAHECGVAFYGALKAYASEVGIDANDVARLRVATWLVHATNDLHELYGDEGAALGRALEETVCLPLLHAEVCRAKADRGATPPPAGSPATPGQAVVVSPHLDDAVLSCGGGIKRLADSGIRVIVATVFTGDVEPGTALSPLAKRAHATWGGGDRPFAARLHEDHAAVALLGARAIHLGLPDAVYRRDSQGHPYYADSSRRAPASEDEANVGPAVIEALRPILAENPKAIVLCPFGVGDHVDHVLVRRAVENLCDPDTIVYYTDYPYAAWTGSEVTSTHSCGEMLTAVTVSLTTEELASKIAAVACHASQLHGLFPSPSQRLRLTVVRHIGTLGPRILGRPDVEKSRVRMGRQIERDTAAAGGERYIYVEGRPDPFPQPKADTGD